MSEARRSRKAADEWSEVVARWRASGETSKVFAARHGVKAGTLLWWSSRLPKEGLERQRVKRRGREPEFTQVRVKSAPTADARGRVEVVTRSGRVVRVEGVVDAGALRAVIEAVESC
ncbi:MAG: hypothetical protein OXR73_37880 [Myxococcales bacterium]|nr:hypothetical protein [Myxococcales bacterium]